MTHSVLPANSPAARLRLATLLHAALFVAGFSLVFIIGWGGAATAAGQLFGQYKNLLGRVGGAVVILFGLATMGIIQIPWLLYDTRPGWNPDRRNGWTSSVLMGLFFAAGWSPCIGTTLGAILTLGFSEQTAGQAMILSSGYALGLGFPFLAIGLAVERAAALVRRLRRYQRGIQIFNGGFLILIGVLLLTNRMTLIAIWAQSNGYYLDVPLGGASVPTYLIAVLAGLVSFLSPCVLPLVPAYVGYLSSQAVNSGLKSEPG